jgi:hypothetical protein
MQKKGNVKMTTSLNCLIPSALLRAYICQQLEWMAVRTERPTLTSAGERPPLCALMHVLQDGVRVVGLSILSRNEYHLSFDCTCLIRRLSVLPVSVHPARHVPQI